jgi:hypothetical protein
LHTLTDSKTLIHFASRKNEKNIDVLDEKLFLKTFLIIYLFTSNSPNDEKRSTPYKVNHFIVQIIKRKTIHKISFPIFLCLAHTLHRIIDQYFLD